MQIIVQMENNSGTLFVTHPLALGPCSLFISMLAYFHSNTTTHIDDEGSGRKKNKIFNKAFFVKRGEQWEPRFTKKKLC